MMTKRGTLLILVSCIFLVTVPLVSFAENGRAVWEKHDETLEQMKADEEQADKDGAAAGSESEGPVFSVKDIIISGNRLISRWDIMTNMPAQFSATGEPIEQTDAENVYDLSAVRDILGNPGEERTITAKSIQGLTQYILSLYQKSNYAGVYVYVPADIIVGGLPNGVLPIKVIEARVADVNVAYQSVASGAMEEGILRESYIQDWSPAKTGEPLDEKEMDEFLNLLNLNPDRYIAAVIVEGNEPNALNVRYDLYEVDQWHWFVQTDNAGTKERRWAPRIGMINTDLLGFDDTFSVVYQAKLDSQWDEDYSIYGSYDFPLYGPRVRLNVFGGYSEFDINPESGDIGFIGNGHFYGGKLNLNVLQHDGWFFDVTGGIEYNRSKVRPSLFPEFLSSDLKFWLWSVGCEVFKRTDMTTISAAFDRYESWGGESEGSEFIAARSGGSVDADSDFTIYQFSSYYTQYLDQQKVQRFAGTFRWTHTNERIAPAKMTSFGGMYSVRGYDEQEYVADGGILLSLQYEFDLVRHQLVNSDEPREISQMDDDEKPWLRKLAPLVFFDYGRAEIRHPGASEKRYEEMFSVGPGMIAEVGDHLTALVYYGYPLKETDNTRTGKGKLNVGFMVRW